MSGKKEFFVPYIEGSLGSKTKKTIKLFVIIALLSTIISAVVFSFSQNKFKNSTFELTEVSEIKGVFHRDPYPMLRVNLGENNYKNILLLGFGKSSANPYLNKLQEKEKSLDGKTLAIKGNLIYYNGKTLLQITSEEEVNLVDATIVETPLKEMIAPTKKLHGEIIDPKCYFGVMKPGKGKIHRSCAVRCISGGIPPVLVVNDENNFSTYYLITDKDGNAIHKEILPFIGKPSEISGVVEKMGDWLFLKVELESILPNGEDSKIY